MSEVLKYFLEASSVKASRSTVMHSLQWVLFLLIAALMLLLLLADLEKEVVTMVIKMFTWLVVCVMAMLGMSYIYFAFKQPDALRSEEFTLNKMAIERGEMGDSKMENISQEIEKVDIIHK